MPAITCACGRSYTDCYYVLCLCGVVHELLPAQPQQSIIDRVNQAVAKQRRIVRALRSRVQKDSFYGDSIARFESLASRFNSPLATDLTQILHACGCARDVAIAELNQRGWPTI
jgi:hypothetical protein